MEHSDDPHDELTIEEFNRQLKGFFSFLKHLCILYFKGIKKYKVAIFIATFIIVAIGGYFIFNPIKKYEATASFTYNDLTRKLFGEMIDHANDLVYSHSYEQLKEITGLSLSEIKSFQKIEATNIYGSPLSDDMSENKEKIFYISVIASDAKVFDSLGTALEGFLNKNISVQQILHRRANEFKAGIAYRKKELQMLDSLAQAYTKSLNKSSSSIVSANTNQFNPTLIFDKGEKITQEIVDMQSFLNDQRVVKMQDPFLVGKRSAYLSLYKIVSVCVAAFIIISILIIFISNLFSNKNGA